MYFGSFFCAQTETHGFKKVLIPGDILHLKAGGGFEKGAKAFVDKLINDFSKNLKSLAVSAKKVEEE